MARLRNRIVKAEFWTDPELLRWPRDKRETYRGLWAMAEDSGCLEDDPFGWKLLLWPSPMDADITVDLLAQWRDELVETGKLVPYEADGKRYLWLKTFHQHEHPRNPQSPNLPLPEWVEWQVTKDDNNRTRSAYVTTSPPAETVTPQYGAATVTPVQSCPVLSSPVQSSPPPEGAPAAPTDEEHAGSDDLVALFVDYHTELGRTKPDRRRIGQMAAAIGEQRKLGAPPDVLKEAVRRIVDEAKSPSLLGLKVGDVERERNGERKVAMAGRSQHGEF